MNFLSFFKRNKSPKIWAYQRSGLYNWIKVISSKRQGGFLNGFFGLLPECVGPFTSEIDCEEFCDRHNMNSYYKNERYEKEKKEKKEACPCEFGDPCSTGCACFYPYSSIGCTRCCKYGSKEQRKLAAEKIIQREKDHSRLVNEYSKLLEERRIELNKIEIRRIKDQCIKAFKEKEEKEILKEKEIKQMTENEKNYKKALEDIMSLENTSVKKKSAVKPNKSTLSKAIAIAKECLEKSNKTPEKIKAPFGCIVDDEGTILAGTWSRKNGGHGDTWWRFDAEECSNDNDD